MKKRAVSPASLSAAERRLRSRLHQLLSNTDGFLHGSLIVMARRCGKPTCRCATEDDARHTALCLGQTHQGKTTMVHIPKELEPLVRQWVGNFQDATDLLEQLSQQGRERLASAKAQKRAARTAKSSAKRAPKTAEPPRKPS